VNRTLPGISRIALTALLLLSVTRAQPHPGPLDAAGCHADARSHKTHCHPKRAAQLPPLDAEGVLPGVVRWVSDGDTLQVHVRGKLMDVRLAEVDAPERDQPYGWNAALALIDLVRGREVRIAPYDVDRYGRVVAHLYVGDLDVGHELVRQGAAWFYTRYADSATLYGLEQQARDAKRGLWALAASERIEPWEWRRQQRKAVDGSAGED
jgi:endonuclease YncB( thermonuclease family)